MRGMTGVTTQAEKRRRLAQQVIDDGSMGFVAIVAVFGDRWVFPHEGSLFFGVARVAQQIDRFRLQVPLVLAVGIVAA